MRTLNFAKRNFKEIIRDPLSIIFAIVLPLFLLFIFQQFKIPNDAYKLENFTPGIMIFSFSFITLFTARIYIRVYDFIYTDHFITRYIIIYNSNIFRITI